MTSSIRQPLGRADVHVFDEPKNVAAGAEMRSHRSDRVVVDAALDDHVHLYRRQPGRRGSVDSRED